MLNESLKNISAKDISEQIRAAETAKPSRKADERGAAGFADEVKRIIRADERRAVESSRVDAELKKSSRRNGSSKAAAKNVSGAESRAATDRNQGANNMETRKHVAVTETAAGSKSAVSEYAPGKPAGSVSAKEFKFKAGEPNGAYAVRELPVDAAFAAIPATPLRPSIEGAALEVRNNQASELISAALAEVSSMLNLPSSVSFDEESLIRFDQESLEQFAEILQALESIGNLLDEVAAGGENLDVGGVFISADEAAMLSADLRVEKFHIQMGLNMIGAREIVSDIMAEKSDAQLPASGISQAADPASLGMSTVDTARVFGSLTAEDLTAAIERIKLAKSGHAENAAAQNTKTELTAADSQEMRAMFKTASVNVKPENVKAENINVNNIKIDDIDVKNNKPENISANNIKIGNANINNNKAESAGINSVKPEEVIENNMTVDILNVKKISGDEADVNNVKQESVTVDNIKPDNVNVNNVKVDNAVREDVKADSAVFQNVKAENVNADSVKVEGVKVDNVKIENVKIDNVKAEDVKVDNVKTEDVKIDNVKVEDVKTEQAKVENIKVEDVKAEDVKTEQVKIENVKVEDVKAEDVKIEQAKVENVKVENVKTEDVKLEQVKAENIKAQDVKVENVKAEHVEADKVDDVKADNTDSEPVKTNVAKSEYAAVENAKTELGKPKNEKPETAKAKDVKSENAKPEAAKIFNSINIPLSVSELTNANKTREANAAASSDAKYAAGFAGVSMANEEAAESAKSDKGAFTLNGTAQQNIVTASESDGVEPQADIVQADIAQAKAQAAVEHVQKATNAFSRVDNEEVIRQITEKMHHAIRNGVQEVRMVLRPEALGEVRMSLRVEGDVVMARIQVENSQVKAIVESRLQDLKDSLEQQNLQAGAFSVDVGSDKERSPREAWQELAETARQNKFREGGVERDGLEEAGAVGAAAGIDTGRRFGGNTFELFI